MLPFLLLSDRFLTAEFHQLLQKALRDNNLKIQIGKIHWETWNGLVGTQVALKDSNTGRVLIGVKRIYVKINPLILMTKFQTPEASLREVVLVQPRLEIQRFLNNTWNLEHYFKRKKRCLVLAGVVKITDGQIVFKDERYGNYRLQKVSGSFDLKKFPFWRWSLRGQVDLGTNSSWKCQGQLRQDQQAGYGSITINQAFLTRFIRFIPRLFSYQVDSGLVDLQLKFALAKGYLGIEKMKVVISNANLTVPPFLKTVQLKYLQGEFSPNLLTIAKADLLYDQTIICISGTLHPKEAKLDTTIAASRINLADSVPKDCKDRQFSNIRSVPA